jgi:membrane protease YdiL (CAAX protease family)
LAEAHGWPSLRKRFSSISRRIAAIAVISAIGVKALLGGLTYLAEILGADFFAEPITDPLLADRLAGLAVVAPVTILLAPLWEELFFRGLLIERLHRHLPLGICVLLSSLLFALVHDNKWALGLIGLLLFSERFAIGAVAAVLALRYRSLTPAFLCHAASNAIAELSSVLIPS